jgi:hypothetical protein
MLEIAIEQQRIRVGERFSISFQRTLRIPDDGRTYPLPPGLGAFPLFKVEDYRDRVPRLWQAQGGAFIPMYQREALWLGFSAAAWKPNAVKVAVGMINTISGARYDERLHADPQDYLVCPPQLWLDGINAGHGAIRQFVAMPLGQGYTVEAALTGDEHFGGMQIAVFEPKPGQFPDEPPPSESGAAPRATARLASRDVQPMGMGAGGLMRQKIYPDPHGIDVWDQNNHSAVVVHLVNSLGFRQITGADPPPPPIDARTYTDYGLPWFDLYDETQSDVAPPERLTDVKTVTGRKAEVNPEAAPDDTIDVPEPQIKKLRGDSGEEG